MRSELYCITIIHWNISGSINFSPSSDSGLARPGVSPLTPLTQYVESNLLRRHKTARPTHFGNDHIYSHKASHLTLTFLQHEVGVAALESLHNFLSYWNPQIIKGHSTKSRHLMISQRKGKGWMIQCTCLVVVSPSMTKQSIFQVWWFHPRRAARTWSAEIERDQFW